MSTKIKARFIGKGTNILGDAYIGEETWGGDNCLLDGLNTPLHIGKFCVIASFAAIYTHNTMWRDIYGRCQSLKIIYPVEIHDFCRIGHGTVVVPKGEKPIKIGPHSIVQALSVVSTSVPPWSIYTRSGKVKEIERNPN